MKFNLRNCGYFSSKSGSMNPKQVVVQKVQHAYDEEILFRTVGFVNMQIRPAVCEYLAATRNAGNGKSIIIHT